MSTYEMAITLLAECLDMDYADTLDQIKGLANNIFRQLLEIKNTDLWYALETICLQSNILESDFGKRIQKAIEEG